MSASVRVLVDTSAWIDYFAGDEHVKRALEAAMDDGRVEICGQILQEVLQGTRDDRSFEKLERDMSIWTREAETPEDFVEAARVYARLRWKGLTVPPSDCLIAALAKRCKLEVYATDPHFAQIPGLRLLDLSTPSS